MTRRRSLLVIFVLGVLLLALSPIAFAAAIGQNPPHWVPAPLVNFAFDVRLTTAPLAKKVISLSRGSPADKRIYFAGQGEEVRFRSGGLELVGSVYGANSAPDARPGVLLLHGSTPEGRRMGLYRIFAETLADRGYLVLAIDQRGYGKSPGVPDPSRADAYDYVGDAVRALAYLAALPGVDTARLHVIGHSFGVGIALNAGLLEPHTRSIVVISPGAPGPPKPMAEILAETRAETRAEIRDENPERSTGAGRYFARRALRYGSAFFVPGVDYIGQPKPLEALAAEELANTRHKPLLIVTDAFEPEETHVALGAWQSALAGPSRLLVAAEADHYLNTAGFGRLVIYDVRAVAGVVGEIDAWFGGSGAGCGTQGSCSWPGVAIITLLVSFMVALALVLIAWFLLRRRSTPRPA